MVNDKPPFYGSDQRRHPRMPFETMVAMIYSNRCTFESSSQISEGGMLLRVYETVPVHETVELNFKLPTGIFISTSAEVLYILTSITGEQYLGLCFIKTDDVYTAAIRDLVVSAI